MRRARILPLIRAAMALGLAAAGGAVRAEDWPARAITMVVPYAAGGPTDAVGRLFAQHMSETLGTPIVTENVAGGGGMTGAARIAHAVPDGYQVLLGGAGTVTYNQILHKNPPFNSLTDFAPVALLTQQAQVLLVRKDLPADGLQDFIRYLKTDKAATFGSAGAGSSTHLGCVMLNVAIGASPTHVPYRGAAPATQNLIAGRIDYICDIVLDAVPHIRAGTVKAIAMLSRARAATLPDLPTADEQGLANFDNTGWYGLFLPRGTPPAIVQRLHDAAAAALDRPALIERMHGLGVEVVPPERRGSDYLARFLKDDIEKWKAPIRASGIAAD